MKYRILFDPHSFLKPVIKWLQDHYDVEFITIYEAFSQYRNKYADNLFKVFQELSVTEKYISRFPSWFHVNINILEHITTQSVKKQLHEYGPFISTIDAYLEYEDISLILLWNDVTAITKSLTYLGRKHRIPTLHLMHGGLPIAFIPVHGKIWADKLAVFGENMRQFYRDNENSDDKIVVTGNPYWDNWGPCQRVEEKKIKNHLGLDNQKKIILFAPTWYHNLYSAENPKMLVKRDLTLVINALNMLEKVEEIELVVKIHPGMGHKAGFYNKELEGSRFTYKIFTDMSPLPIIQSADVVICSGSLIIESLMVGKPSVLFTPGISSLEFNITNYQISTEKAPFYIALTLSQLFKALRKSLAMNDNFSKKEIDYYLYRSNGLRDGKAAERVGRLAMEMIDGKSPKEFKSPVSYKKRKLYHANIRKDIPSMIESFPKKILEIGCAEGGMGELIKEKWCCEYVGIEINEESAKEAKKKLDRVIVADVEKICLEKIGLGPESFDYIIYGDVLEHLYDPWTILHEHKKYIKDEGYIIASIPNIRNIAIIDGLLNGRWTYRDEGILDSTHLRFFTLYEVKQMVTKCGYKIIEINNMINPMFDEKKLQGSINIDLPKMIIKNVSKEEALELQTIQFVVKAKKVKMTLSEKDCQCPINSKSPLRMNLISHHCV